ncbi:MAG: elongation factor 4 [Candidatus Harrisonbacteria bacterium]|nr:elongation factor 4 [Candidatus Harrisonbacteria bacterium]
MENIRNFCIIAHVDHGKSTLADRFLELTGTVEKRRMKEQYLDQLESERERGITIKMAPVRMIYRPSGTKGQMLNVKSQLLSDSEYILNLIDTPGHTDFSYEVSRALAAVDGAILLVDATQGIQAQTLANFNSAKRAGLKIIGAVNKIDMNPVLLPEVVKSTAELLDVPESEIFKVSGKTGQGVGELLGAVIEKIPPPSSAVAGFGGQGRQASEGGQQIFRALIFDSFYHEHKGIVAAVRVFNGLVGQDSDVTLIATAANFKVKELGHFAPELSVDQKLENGQIGYIATGLKDPELLKIGDTVVSRQSLVVGQNLALPGYKDPQPVVFVSFYPEESDDYEDLKRAFGKLKLNDSALKFDPDFNEFLGRGFKTGFLGKLHFEITAERLEKEFDIRTVHSFPSVSYKVRMRNGEWAIINNPKDFPDDYLEVMEPIAKVEILTPSGYLGSVLQLQEVFRLKDLSTQNFGGRTILITGVLPLSELIRDFDDQLKSISAGYASLSYGISDYEKTEVVKLSVLVAGQEVGGLTRIIHKEDAEKEARKTVERLKSLLPKQQFAQALQAVAGGRILARENIPALKKLLGNFGKTGGDRTRKMKLWKKQQRGKEKLKELASKSKIDVPASIFKELLKK